MVKPVEYSMNNNQFELLEVEYLCVSVYLSLAHSLTTK